MSKFPSLIIGEGKRRTEKAVHYSSDAIDLNQFTFATILFKIWEAIQ